MVQGGNGAPGGWIGGHQSLMRLNNGFITPLNRCDITQDVAEEERFGNLESVPENEEWTESGVAPAFGPENSTITAPRTER